MKRGARVALLILVSARLAIAQEQWLKPPDALVLDGVPPIPMALTAGLNKYKEVSADSIVGWDPGKLEPIILRKPTNSLWELRQANKPGWLPSLLRDTPSRTHAAYWDRRGRYFVFLVDTSSGAEQTQLYRGELQNDHVVLLTDGKSKNLYPVFSNSGNELLFSSNRRDSKNFDIYTIDPLNPQTVRLVATLKADNWAAFDWSPDDRQAILSEYKWNGESHLWILDIATGKKKRLTPKKGSERVFNGSFAQFSKDGKGVYHVTDRDCDYQRLAYIDITTKRYTYLTTHIKWDVEEFVLSPDRTLLAFITNEDGYSRLHLLDASTNEEKPFQGMPKGVISGLTWHSDGKHLGFGISSRSVPGDVYSIDVLAGKLVRWSSVSPEPLPAMPEPELVRFKSFDDRLIPAFVYRPSAKFTGRLPVFIDIHGGPELQARPEYSFEGDYLSAEFGVAVIYPNYRGSWGYGRTFLDLDNGYLRENATKDIGALIDWVATRPDLDADRIMLRGTSYGGYLALSVAARHSSRISGIISLFGVSNLATYLDAISAFIKGPRRAEFGDERNPRIRKFLESISPQRKASEIAKPVLIIHGKNDYRAPVDQAEQMVAALKRAGTSVWYILAKNEGHQLAWPESREFALLTQVMFSKSIWKKT